MGTSTTEFNVQNEIEALNYTGSFAVFSPFETAKVRNYVNGGVYSYQGLMKKFTGVTIPVGVDSDSIVSATLKLWYWPNVPWQPSGISHTIKADNRVNPPIYTGTSASAAAKVFSPAYVVQTTPTGTQDLKATITFPGSTSPIYSFPKITTSNGTNFVNNANSNVDVTAQVKLLVANNGPYDNGAMAFYINQPLSISNDNRPVWIYDKTWGATKSSKLEVKYTVPELVAKTIYEFV